MPKLPGSVLVDILRYPTRYHLSDDSPILEALRELQQRRALLPLEPAAPEPHDHGIYVNRVVDCPACGGEGVVAKPAAGQAQEPSVPDVAAINRTMTRLGDIHLMARRVIARPEKAVKYCGFIVGWCEQLGVPPASIFRDEPPAPQPVPAQAVYAPPLQKLVDAGLSGHYADQIAQPLPAQDGPADNSVVLAAEEPPNTRVVFDLSITHKAGDALPVVTLMPRDRA